MSQSKPRWSSLWSGRAVGRALAAVLLLWAGSATAQNREETIRVV